MIESAEGNFSLQIILRDIKNSWSTFDLITKSYHDILILKTAETVFSFYSTKVSLDFKREHAKV
jgi:hypothetical protein